MIFGRFGKFGRYGKRYNMSRKAANDTLKNVLAACNIESDRINFDLLLIKGLAQTNFVDSCKWIAIGFLFLVLISPAALMNNELKVDSGGTITEHIIIEDHKLYKDEFVLKLVGKDIDYDLVCAKNAEGKTIYPTDIDEKAGLVTFPYNNESLTIFIQDKEGHTLNASLSQYRSEDLPKHDEAEE